MITKKFVCDICGHEFSTESYEFGSSTHHNYCNPDNIKVYISRGTLIKKFDLRDDNYCNTRDVYTRYFETHHNCVKIYLKKHNPELLEEFISYFQEREELLNEIFSGDNEQFRENLTGYWARENQTIDLYKKTNGKVVGFSFGMMNGIFKNKTYFIKAGELFYSLDEL